MSNLRFVIIGSGAAGTSAAFNIRENYPTASITIISEEPYQCYYKSDLPKYLCGKVKKNDLFYKTSENYTISNIALRLSQKVTSIDSEHKYIYLAHKERIPYDKLLITTGTKKYIPPSLRVFSEHFSYLMNLKDAEALVDQKNSLEKPLIIGGGLTAIKLALALKSIEKEVHYLLLKKNMIKQLQDEQTMETIEKMLQTEKIPTYTGTSIQSITRTAPTYEVTFSTKETKHYSIIFLAAGVQPNITLAKTTGLKSDWGILVNNCFETSITHIYAAGDIAQIYNPTVKDYWVNFGWPNALKQGKIAAENMCGRKTEYETSDVNIFNIRGHIIKYKNWE